MQGSTSRCTNQRVEVHNFPDKLQFVCLAVFVAVRPHRLSTETLGLTRGGRLKPGTWLHKHTENYITAVWLRSLACVMFKPTIHSESNETRCLSRLDDGFGAKRCRSENIQNFSSTFLSVFTTCSSFSNHNTKKWKLLIKIIKNNRNR